MVEEFYGQIPPDLREPALDFLANGREKLEKFYQIHAYHLQRRAMTDLKHADMYQGMLVEVKALLAAIARIKKPEELKFVKQGKDPSSYEKDVKDFLDEGKKRGQVPPTPEVEVPMTDKVVL